MIREQPAWLDATTYPFSSNYVDLPDGRMHYVDEGQGETLLMLHGTPTWSFLYRHLITGLSDRYRVIAPDHLGFGLSDKPEGYSYRPEDHARNLTALIQKLDLRDITLVVHDFGGPIGLSYALDHPENVKRLIIFNTWMWPLQDDAQIVRAGRLLGSGFGRMLCMRFNIEVNVIMPYAFGQRAKLTPVIKSQYRGPSQDATTREAIWVFARELLGSQSWYTSLWEKRAALQDIPTLLLWGMKDRVIRPHYLTRWQTALPDAQTITFAETGHYVQEEQGVALVPIIADFIASTDG